MLPSADQLFKDADFIFQQDLAPAHTAKSIKSWLNDHGVGVVLRNKKSKTGATCAFRGHHFKTHLNLL